MISHPALLADMRRQLAALQSDLRSQAASTSLDAALRSEWQSARMASRTSASFRVMARRADNPERRIVAAEHGLPAVL